MKTFVLMVNFGRKPDQIMLTRYLRLHKVLALLLDQRTFLLYPFMTCNCTMHSVSSISAAKVTQTTAFTATVTPAVLLISVITLKNAAVQKSQLSTIIEGYVVSDVIKNTVHRLFYFSKSKPCSQGIRHIE